MSRSTTAGKSETVLVRPLGVSPSIREWRTVSALKRTLAVEILGLGLRPVRAPLRDGSRISDRIAVPCGRDRSRLSIRTALSG